MTTEPREHEPSMEEILSSIRRIIADEEAEESHPDDELGAAEAHADALNDDAEALARAAEDEDPEDVLELTRVVRDGGEVVDLNAGGAAATALHGEPTPDPESEPLPGTEHDELELAPLETEPDREPQIPTWHESKQKEPTAVETKSVATGPELVSAPVASATTGAFAKLSEAVHKTPPEESVADDSGRTIEQFVEDMIRPLLKEWLEENLPPIVERLVQREIQKIARRAELV